MRASGLVVALVLAADVPMATAQDVFTPLTAMPFNSSTMPVPGTDGRWHLVYELQLANTRAVPATLEGVQIVEGPTDATPPRVLGRFGPDSFPLRLHRFDSRPAADAKLELSSSRLFLIDLALPADRPLPPQVRHVLELSGAGVPAGTAIEQTYSAAAVQLLRDRLPVLGPPLAGKGWVAFNGCCAPGVGHRSTAVPVNGRLHYAQRFAIDWVRLDGDGRMRSGPAADVDSWTAYGEPLLAVADGTVVATLDGLPNQRPPNNPDPSTITLQNVDGNHVVLDIGRGVFAFYGHIQPGTVRVRVGERVQAGAVLGSVGNSGNSSAPHLHFHLMDGPSVLGSEGVPYVLDGFELAGNIPEDAAGEAEGRDFDGSFERFLQAPPQRRRGQFPLENDVVDFPPR